MSTEVKKESLGLRIVVTIIWIALAVGVDIFAVVSKGFMIGMIAEAAFFLITYLVPYLRKKGSTTRWVGFLAFLSALWFAYCQFFGGAE